MAFTHTQPIECIDFDGVVSIHLQDGTTIPARRDIRIALGVNGDGTSQVTAGVPGSERDDGFLLYGMVDSDHPAVYQFMEYVVRAIAAPGPGTSTTFEVSAAATEVATD